MVSDKKRLANQQNAQASTGPDNTDETRYNGTWHGFRGSRVVLSNESMDEYRAMAETMYAVFQPWGTYEYTLVKRIADRTWELERAVRLKTDVSENVEYRDIRENETRILEKYETSIERSLYRTRRELSSVQQLRGKTTFAPDESGPPEPSPGKGPTLIVNSHYIGPVLDFTQSQGEAAVEELLNRAKARIRRMDAPYGQSLFSAYIDKCADIALGNESQDPPDEPESDDDDQRQVS